MPIAMPGREKKMQAEGRGKIGYSYKFPILIKGSLCLSSMLDTPSTGFQILVKMGTKMEEPLWNCGLDVLNLRTGDCTT